MTTSVTYLDYLQNESQEKLQRILKMPISKQVKVLMIETLIHTVRELYSITHYNEPSKNHSNFDQLSTSISECHSVSIQIEKDL